MAWSVADYNINPNVNVTINGINIAEGCPAAGYNNALRQIMADIKGWTVSSTPTYLSLTLDNSSTDVPILTQVRQGAILWTVGGVGDGTSWGVKNNVQARPALKFGSTNGATFDGTAYFQNDGFFSVGYDSGNANRPKVNFANGAGIVFDKPTGKYIFYCGAAAMFSIDNAGNIRALGNIIGFTAP